MATIEGVGKTVGQIIALPFKTIGALGKYVVELARGTPRAVRDKNPSTRSKSLFSRSVESAKPPEKKSLKKAELHGRDRKAKFLQEMSKGALGPGIEPIKMRRDLLSKVVAGILNFVLGILKVKTPYLTKEQMKTVVDHAGSFFKKNPDAQWVLSTIEKGEAEKVIRKAVDNIISDPFVSRSDRKTLADQIMKALYAALPIRFKKDSSQIIMINGKEYENVGVVGYGANAMVYKYKSKDGDTVAVKAPKVDREDPPNRDDLLKEAEIHRLVAGKDGHRNILGFKGVVEDPKSIYFLMDYADGGTLKNIAEKLDEAETKHKISHTQRIAIAQYLLGQVMDGMIHCKDCGVLHRDLKPENVLFDKKTLQPKLADFGSSNIGLTTEDKMTGTKYYISPEEVDVVVTDEVNEKSDTWSLGIMIYELITGKVPIESEAMTMYQYTLDLEKFVNSKKPLRENVTAFAKVINKMLNPDPEKRPSLEELRKMPFFTDPMHDDDTVKALLKKIV